MLQLQVDEKCTSLTLAIKSVKLGYHILISVFSVAYQTLYCEYLRKRQ